MEAAKFCLGSTYVHEGHHVGRVSWRKSIKPFLNPFEYI